MSMVKGQRVDGVQRVARCGALSEKASQRILCGSRTHNPGRAGIGVVRYLPSTSRDAHDWDVEEAL